MPYVTDLQAGAAAVIAAFGQLAFNPHQRRDSNGRWVRIGGGSLPGGEDAAPDVVSEEDDELYRELRSEYGWNLHQAASDILRATRERGETDPDPRWLEADPRWEPGDADPTLEKLVRNLEWDLEDQPELADAAMELLLDYIKAEYPESVASLPDPPQRGALPQLHPRADASDGFEGAQATRADALTAALRSGVAAQKPLSAGFMGDTRLLTLNDGSQVVYKRAISTLRPGDLNWEVKDQTDAEHLSSLLAAAVGAPAPVVHRLNDTELAMELVSGRPADASALTDARRRDILATDDAVRIGLLDVLLNNVDRHGGNWMVDDAGAPVAIDHGMAFAVDPPAGTSGATKSPFATEHFINPDGTFRATNSLTPSDIARLEGEIERIRPQFERAGRAGWLDAALGRLRQLGERAQGPAISAVTAGNGGGLGLRARVAAALLELAFNPHQRRDSNGRWVRLPTNELKRPRRPKRGKGDKEAGVPRAGTAEAAAEAEYRKEREEYNNEILDAARQRQETYGKGASPRLDNRLYRAEQAENDTERDAEADELRRVLEGLGMEELPQPPSRRSAIAKTPLKGGGTRPPVTASYGERRAALEDSTRGGISGESKISGGIMGDTRRVKLADGTDAIYKGALSDWPMPGGVPPLTPKDQTDAEEMASLMASALGVRAPAVQRISDTEIYMEVMPGQTAAEWMRKSGFIDNIIDSDDAIRMGLLDVLLDNPDRHNGNFMVDDDDKIYAIDHGLSFVNHYGVGRSAAARSPFAAEHFITNLGLYDANPLTKRDIQSIHARLDALRPQFKAAGRESWLDVAKIRLDKLEPYARGQKDIYS